MKQPLDAARIRALLSALNQELEKDGIQGELYLVGGAVMCLVFEARKSTQDLDALFVPTQAIRLCAKRVAAAEFVSEDWLNDAVKGFLSQAAGFVPFIQLSSLKVMTATPEYLLAMKCLAMRLGQEFHDEADVRYLIRYLNFTSSPQVIEILKRYYPLDGYPQKTLYALAEILGES